MKKITVSLVIACIALLQNCVVVVSRGVPMNSGYSRLSSEDKKWIVFTDTAASVCNTKKDGKIHAITGNQLRTCIDADEKAMVHIWVPTGSRYCPLSYVQSYCDSLGITLYVVARAYANIKSMYYEQATIPGIVFSINEKFYASRGCGSDCTGLFINDLIKDAALTGKVWINPYYNHRFLFFNKGILTSFSDSLESDEAVK